MAKWGATPLVTAAAAAGSPASSVAVATQTGDPQVIAVVTLLTALVGSVASFVAYEIERLRADADVEKERLRADADVEKERLRADAEVRKERLRALAEIAKASPDVTKVSIREDAVIEIDRIESGSAGNVSSAEPPWTSATSSDGTPHSYEDDPYPADVPERAAG